MHDGSILRGRFIFYPSGGSQNAVSGRRCPRLLIIRRLRNGLRRMNAERLPHCGPGSCGQVVKFRGANSLRVSRGATEPSGRTLVFCLRRSLNYWPRWPFSIVRSYSRQTDSLGRPWKSRKTRADHIHSSWT